MGLLGQPSEVLLNGGCAHLSIPVHLRRIGQVLGRNGGVIFIPPQLAEGVVEYSEITHLRDMFGHQRLREGKYTAGQIDARWSAPIEADFTQWLKENIDKLPVAREQVEEILKRRQK